MESLGRLSCIPEFDLIKFIFLCCDISSQIAFSNTCKFLYNHPWFKEHWKKRAIELWTLITPTIPVKYLHEALSMVNEVKWEHIVLHFSNSSGVGRSYQCRKWYAYPGTEAPSSIIFGRYDSTQSYSPTRDSLNIDSHGEIRFGSHFYGNGFLKDDDRIYRGCFNYFIYDGEGDLFDVKTKSRYIGEFNNGRKHGKGTITFFDGFKHTGEWENGEPKEIFVHPNVEQCIQKNVCTRTLGEEYYPQLFFNRFCCVCKSNGKHTIKSLFGVWAMDLRCQCVLSECTHSSN
eukprot:TRINITY_DN1560_c0_g1_i2.p1 TRINITY_DN1560_c0_g1~~TRINITY_DN1560_c0_g1_i2.p1  ORF type:complete len:288 (-),score=33.20 TRINITY_DN1560_c0_g1_i2:42-905(-)